MIIRDFQASDADQVLALNTANVPAVGKLDLDRLNFFARISPHFKLVDDDGEVKGMLIGLTEAEVEYPSPNFRWFRSRYSEFAYVDRIALAASVRGQGLGPRLYQEFCDWAREQGRSRVCAEVNTIPENPHSMHFHQAFGFAEVGRCNPYSPSEEVVMLVKKFD